MQALSRRERIQKLAALGRHLRAEDDEFLAALMARTEFTNAWFTVANQKRSLAAIATHFLTEDVLNAFTSAYPTRTAPASAPKTIGLVLAGNIPLVCMHDVICTFLSGHRAQVKLSQKDPFVLPYILKLLKAPDYFDIVDKLSGFDAVIATGSNNSARYFEAYFGKYPHIIRRGRNGVAVLDGTEEQQDLRKLGDDIMSFFGLGCRNVSKLYVPRGYDFTPLLEVLHEWRAYQNHTKWKNNFDYQFALLTLNKEPFLHNGALILRRAEALAAPIACVHYEEYDAVDPAEIAGRVLRERREQIQLLVAPPDLLSNPAAHAFGKAQEPAIDDFADGVDTMAFLTAL